MHPAKASTPMVVTDEGITVDLHPSSNILDSVRIIALHASRESKTGLPSATVMLSNSGQLFKMPQPIFVVVEGISMLRSEEHPQNAL